MYLSNTRLTWRTPKIDKSGASKSGGSCHIESTVRPSLLAYCLLLTKTGIPQFYPRIILARISQMIITAYKDTGGHLTRNRE